MSFIFWIIHNHFRVNGCALTLADRHTIASECEIAQCPKHSGNEVESNFRVYASEYFVQ